MFTDWRGNKLEINDTVVYTTRRGSNMDMVEGKVVAMIETTTESYYRGPTTEKKLIVKPIRQGHHDNVTELSHRRSWPSPHNRRISLKYVTKVV